MIRRKRNRRQAHRDEKGMIVVEATLSFTLFILVTVAIIYLINIFTLHNKVQFAINSAAHQISSYSYLYQVLGLRDASQTVEQDGQKYTKPIDETADQVVDTLNKVQSLYSGVEEGNVMLQMAEDTFSSGQDSVSKVTALMEDPQSLLNGMIYMGFSGADYLVKSAAGRAAAKALTREYLSNGDTDADAYLKAYGVMDGYAGLDFSGTTIFCDTGDSSNAKSNSNNRLIDIVVEYDVDLSFVGLVLPKDTLHIVQRVTVPAWLNGDGRTYGGAS